MICRDSVRKGKMQMEMNLVRDVKNNKGFFRYFGQKKQAKENVPPLINEKGKLAPTDKDKAVKADKARDTQRVLCLSLH